MNVLLVSQCSKRALVETRRILDQFAERKGERTWSTVITLEGLNTLRRLLRKTARRNTAVACHWLKSTGPELYWIVGNARRFNHQGTVPTNSTGRDILRSDDENHWHTGEVVALLAAIAGLFHDVGKANWLFQQKLFGRRKVISEPLRHEWVSLRIFQAFVDTRDDDCWLSELASITPQKESSVLAKLAHLADKGDIGRQNPFAAFSPIANVIGWLIVSHHRLPSFDDKHAASQAPPPLDALSLTSKRFDASWNSPQWCADSWQATDWQQLWDFPKGTPLASNTWCKKANRLAQRALRCHTLWTNTDWLNDRFTAHLARLSLMLADHVYSAGPAVEKWQDKSYTAYANTDRATGRLKQALDEHNIGVGHNAFLLAKNLPKLRHYLPAISRHKGFKKRSENEAFRWQDKAYAFAEAIAKRSQKQGFFGVNMASTGCGKTFANARIMYGLAHEQQGCRFNVALGLRTLTLQTGDALATRLKLERDDLAVLIGSTAVRQLHQLSAVDAKTGSASAEPLFSPEHIRYDGALDDGPLRRWLTASPALHQLVSAPVLVSTIDHLIPATEGIRGGKQIAPMLRLLTSDLVLDEPDDFGLSDLPALCRLVNWAGLLGSRILLSSATLPPALLNALFAAYQAGRQQYHLACGEPGDMPPICCAWFDEFAMVQQDLALQSHFKVAHQQFVKKRLSALKQQPGLRYGALLPVTSSNAEADVVMAMASAIREGLLTLHHQHHQRHSSGKCVSVGLVRMANIDKLVAVAQQLLTQAAEPDMRIHFCVYHSRHPLIVRSEMEKRLDAVLSRHDVEALWQQSEVEQALLQPETHHVFLVLASPVAEVGRDHDYDWAIAEPSSMRSLIQLAGRVQRHRKQPPATPNILILSHNFKALQGLTPAYCRPGFESKEFRLVSGNMADSLNAAQYQWLGSASAIDMPESAERGPYHNLVALEHAHLAVCLFKGEPQKHGTRLPASGWWQYPVTWSGELQRRSRFRASQPDDAFVLYRDDDDEPLRFCRLEDSGDLTPVEKDQFTRAVFIPGARVEPWLSNEPEPLLATLAEQLDEGHGHIARTYTEIRLPRNSRNMQLWHYEPQLGVYKELKTKRGSYE